ncbi:MAG: OmpA family protein [Saprospiraceae bacterium]
MKLVLKSLIFIVAGSLLMTSCVSSKKYKNLLSEKESLTQSYEKQLTDLKKNFSEKESDLNGKISNLNSELSTSNSEMLKYKNLSEEKAKALTKLEADIKEAFKGIDNPDLKIIQKYDKLYISLPNKILYKKGDDKISKSGEEVLNVLSPIFKENQSMDILIEGHTDSDPVARTKYKFKDNWGLSSARSLNALRYLIKQGVNPKQLSASGRADMDTTGEIMEGKDSQAYERRIEFVVTPDVHKLYSISETLK